MQIWLMDSRTPQKYKTRRFRDVSEVKVPRLKECDKRSRRRFQIEERKKIERGLGSLIRIQSTDSKWYCVSHLYFLAGAMGATGPNLLVFPHSIPGLSSVPGTW